MSGAIDPVELARRLIACPSVTPARGEVFDLLERHDAALCVSDHHDAPSPWKATASWVYVRGHGPGGRYHGRYGDAALKDWARRLRAWREQGRDVYAYFDNDIKAAAPADAQQLKALLGR